MDDTKIPQKNYGKFQGRRPVGRPQQRWEDISRGSSFLLNTGGWRRHSRGHGVTGGELLLVPGPDAGCCIIEGGEEKNTVLNSLQTTPLSFKGRLPFVHTHVTDHGTRSEKICPWRNMPLTDSLEHTNEEKCPKIFTEFKIFYFPWI